MPNTLEKPENGNKIVMAAGGILERVSDKRVEIAIINRKKHGDEWCLPKGKLDAGESWSNAALREIKKETGFVATTKRFAGATHYFADDKPKVVFFWVMEPDANGGFEPTSDVKALEWMSPSEAYCRLTHANQKRLVQDVYQSEFASRNISAPRGILARISYFFGFRSLRWQRLAAAVATYKKELAVIGAATQQTRRDCLAVQDELLCLAEKSLEGNEVDQGWRHFHAAKRIDTLTLDPEVDKSSIRSRVIILRAEISKIKKWRQKAAEKLLGEGNELPTAQELYQLMLLRDEHYSNLAYKASLVRRYLIWMALIIAALVGMFLTLLNVPWIGNMDIGIPGNTGSSIFWFFVVVAIFGLIGGAISAILATPRTLDDARIPELTSTFELTMLRLLTGAGSAIVVVMFLKSDLTGLLANPLSGPIKNAGPPAMYAIAFVAGFTERLVLRAVEYVAGK